MHSRLTSVLPRSESRYTVFGPIGAGGMATVEYAHFTGPSGFSRPVAIKRLHPHLATDPAFASSFLDEARLSARIVHANVVATLDVLARPDEIAVVMEYVHGESLAGVFALCKQRGVYVPVNIAVHLLVGVLHGLHAAHETRDERGQPLRLVHRDVSPENILVGSDGVPRLLDFGIAKANGRARVTPCGELKGKLSYIAPEQYHGEPIDRRVDIYGASVVLWETLTGRKLFDGESDAAVVKTALHAEVLPPSRLVSGVSPQLDAIVLRGLSRDREQRYETAHEMALALEAEGGAASQSEVGAFLERIAGDVLRRRAALLGEMQRQSEVALGATPRRPDFAETRRVVVSVGAGASVAAESERAGTDRSGLRVRRTSPTVVAAVLVVACTACAAWLAFDMHGTESTMSPPPSLKTLSTAQAAEPQVQLPRATALEFAPAPVATRAQVLLESESHVLADVDAPPALLRSRPVDVPPTLPSDAGGPRTRNHEARESASHHGKGRAQGTPRKDCAQPYLVDAQGIRRWKRECL